MALIDDGYPLLVFAPRGPAQAGPARSWPTRCAAAARACCSPRPAGTPGSELPLVASRRRGPRSDRGDPELLSDGRSACARTRPRPGRTAPSAEGHAHAMTMAMRRSLVSSLLAFCRCSPLLCACAAPADKVHVEFWTMSLKPKFTPYFKTLVRNTRRSHPEVELEWVDVPWDAMQTKLTAAIVAGSAPALVQLNVPWAYDYALYGALRPIDDLLGADRAHYTDGAIADLTFNGTSTDSRITTAST